MSRPMDGQSPRRRGNRPSRVDRHGFYASTFTADELLWLDTQPDVRAEFKVLRTKILRLARLTPLKSINKDELDALAALVRIIAALDDMERTGVMRAKVEASAGTDFSEVDALDPQDLGAAE